MTTLIWSCRDYIAPQFQGDPSVGFQHREDIRNATTRTLSKAYHIKHLHKCFVTGIRNATFKHLIFDSSDITGILYNDLLIIFSDNDSARYKEIRIDYAVGQSLSERLMYRSIVDSGYAFQLKRHLQIF